MNTMMPTDKVFKKLTAVCVNELMHRIRSEGCPDWRFDKRYWSDDEAQSLRAWYAATTGDDGGGPDDTFALLAALLYCVTKEFSETDIPRL